VFVYLSLLTQTIKVIVILENSFRHISHNTEYGAIMDRKTLFRYENRILIGLVDFYYEHGYKSDTYMADGVLENKIEARVGLPKGSVSPSPEFLWASQMLEAKGYVRRTQPSKDSMLMCIWPTRQGLDRAEYLKANVLKKIWLFLRENGTSIVISAITTIITLFIAWLFKLFGLGG
jgi:hypothetical protein